MRNPHKPAVILVVAVAVVLAWLTPLEPLAVQQVDAGLKRALVSFASARALNAAISVAQGTEVSVQPLGVGLTLAPGQLLDPINDLVERFADWMLLASIAFGIQKILIALGGYWAISLLLSAALLAWGDLRLGGRASPPWLPRVLAILLVVRFGVPLASLGSEAVFQHFLAADYQASQAAIDAASGNVGRLEPRLDAGSEEAGVLDRMKQWWSDNSDPRAKFEQFREAAERATEHIVNVIVIFLLETLLFPLLMLWGLYGFARMMFGSAPALPVSPRDARVQAAEMS